MNSDKKSVCHAGFATEQEVPMNTCVQIKVEAQDLTEVIEPQIHDNIDKENFKEEFADPEIQNDKVESEINNQNPENNEDKPLKKKVKKQKKKSKKVLQPFDLLEPPSHLLDSYYDLDLSEEFLSQVLKYVDDLCNFINNGDQNLERSMEVNENLNYAVSCYRAKLSQNKQSIDKESQNQEDFKHEIIDDPPDDMPLPDFSADGDEEYMPKKKKIKKSGDLKRKIKRESRENN